MECSDQTARMMFEEHQQAIYRRTDRIFLFLMPLQWLAAIGMAFWISPLTWAGSASAIQPMWRHRPSFGSTPGAGK